MRKIDIEKAHGNIVKSAYDLELVNREAKENLKQLIKTSETLYQNQIKHIVKELVGGEYRLVLLAGPSSSGKTTSSHLIRQMLEKHGKHSIVVSLDDFFLGKEDRAKLPNGEYDYESINILDLDYFNAFIKDLMTKKKAKMPLFDFVYSRRKSEYIDVEIDDDTLVIIEGTHALNPKLLRAYQNKAYKIYICVNSNYDIGDKVIIPAKRLRLMRRLIRDYYHRGHSIDKTFDMWKNVLKGEDIYIKPYKNEASYLLDSTHIYEPLVYATYLIPLLEKSNSKEAKELIKMLDKCGKLSKNVVPKNSLLWEFLMR